MIKKKGTYGELYVAAELTKVGFLVSIPLEQHSPYDLIVDKGGHLYKCQVKTTTSNQKRLKIGLVSHVNTSGKHMNVIYKKKDVSHFLLFDTKTNNILVIPHPGKSVNFTFSYDSLPLTSYMTLDKLWARVFDRNWSLFDKTFQDAQRVNYQYCLNTYHEAVLSNQEVLPEEWGSYFVAGDFARAFGVSRGYAKKFVEKTLQICYSRKHKGYSTSLLVNRSTDYVEA